MRVGRTLALFAVLVGYSVPCTGADEAAPLGRVDYLPYRVSLSVAFSPDAEITEAFRQLVCSTLRTRLKQTFGAAWIFPPGAAVRSNDRLTPPDESGLERLSYRNAVEQLSGIACDKAYFLTIGRQGPKWRVAGREWDRTLQTLGTTASETTVDRGRVPDAALTAVERLFSPLLIVNDADRDSKSATLTIRAGSIPFGDPNFAPLREGDILRPAFRFLDSKRAVRSIQSVPWTYLVLQPLSKGQSQVKASVVSSYRAPLAANMRRRVEAVAVRVRPELSGTHLKLVAGRDPPQPQGGLFVSISGLSAPATIARSSTLPVAGGPPASVETAQRTLLSDRRGEVTIPVDLRRPIVRLEVHSGAAILARRPFVPGLDAETTLEIADDRVRLGTEREIDVLESQLIETVAKRGALIARTRAALSRTDTQKAQQLISEVERLPGGDEYFAQLNRIRVLALEEAHNRKDRVAERRIEDLCRKTLERITQYLSDDRIATFKEELATLTNAKKVAIELQNAPMRREQDSPPRDNAPLRRRSPDELKPTVKKPAEERPARPSSL
jgi:hypothetical protein